MQTKLPLVVDVSGYEDRIEWAQATERPAMIIARAGYGYKVDAYYHEHMRQAKALGIKRGMYHYFYAVPLKGKQSAAECVGDQAEAFVQLLHEADWTPDEPIFLDWETAGNERAPLGYGLQKLFRQWLDHVQRLTGIVPGVYSRKDQLDRLSAWGSMPAWIKEHDMWLAWYPYQPDTATFDKANKFFPQYLDRVAMWQYSDDGRIGGMIPVHNYDFNFISPWYAEKIGLTKIAPPTPAEPLQVVITQGGISYSFTDAQNAVITTQTGETVRMP